MDLSFIVTIEASKIMIDIIEKDEEAHIVFTSTFNKISEIITSAWIFALGRFPLKKLEDLNPESHEVIIVLDELEIPGNIGTIIRS